MNSEKNYNDISVTALILWEGKVLLVQRANDEDFLPNYWEQAGGKVELEENQEEAIVREVREETGIEISPIRAYHQFKYMHRNGRVIHEFAYICELIGKQKINLSSEHQNFKWLVLEELKEIQPMTVSMREIVHRGFQEVLKRTY